MYMIFTKNVRNAQSLTASSEVSTFEVAGLQDPLGSTVWRSTSTTASVIGQFDQAQTPDAWGSLYTNAQSGDTERLRLADTEAELTSGPSLDTGALSVWPGTGDLSEWPYVHARHLIGAPVAAAWFRIDYDFSGNTDGYVQVGAISLDTRFAPANGHVTPWSAVPRSSAIFASVLAGGSENRGGGTHKDDSSFVLGGLTQAEWVALRRELRGSNSVLPALAVLDEDEDTYPLEYMYYGYPLVRSLPDQKSHFTAAITMREP